MTVDRRTVLAAAAAGWAASACGWLPREAVVPMPVLREAGPCRLRAPTLVVMLPGAGSLPIEFVQEGFVDALRRSGAAADCAIADSHLGYFRDRSVFDRLRTDVVGPARAQGYRQVWLVGISLGGFGALAYGLRHGADIDGIVALAPYLGERALLREIADAGGPQAWQRTAAPPEAPGPGGEDPARTLWRWLAAPPAGAPPVYLGFGSEDRLAVGHRLLAGALEPSRVTQVPGGHDWPPWRALWEQWLSRGLLPRDCAAAG
jgi:pimeloyl-ACP methyl ester carboxylesterase